MAEISRLTRLMVTGSAGLRIRAASISWRERDSEEDGMEVRLASFDGEEPDSTDAPWRIGQLPSGREYLWRETSDPDDPEVHRWSQSTLDSGEPFWYDEDGEVSLTDPFARALADEE